MRRRERVETQKCAPLRLSIGVEAEPVCGYYESVHQTEKYMMYSKFRTSCQQEMEAGFPNHSAVTFYYSTVHRSRALQDNHSDNVVPHCSPGPNIFSSYLTT